MLINATSAALARLAAAGTRATTSFYLQPTKPRTLQSYGLLHQGSVDEPDSDEPAIATGSQDTCCTRFATLHVIPTSASRQFLSYRSHRGDQQVC